MEIPNELNKLLARLQEVTSQTNRVSETCSSGSRPTPAEIDLFLSRYNFAADAQIEPVEISKDGVFDSYMFAIWHRGSDDLSLLTMRTEQTWPEDAR